MKKLQTLAAILGLGLTTPGVSEADKLGATREPGYDTRADGLYEVIREDSWKEGTGLWNWLFGDDGRKITGTRNVSEKLVCAKPEAPNLSNAADPASRYNDGIELDNLHRERENYLRCLEKHGVAYNREQVTALDLDKLYAATQENIPNQEQIARAKEAEAKRANADAEKEYEKNRGIEAAGGDGVKSNISPVITTSPTIAPQANFVPGTTKEYNARKQEQMGYHPSLTLEEQYAICTETEEGKSLAEYIGEVRFDDCKHAPQEAKENSMENLVDKLVGAAKEGDLILYCGMTTEPVADQCPPYKDRGNLGLAWDRAHGIGQYCEAQLPETTSLGFALGVNGKRAAKAYIVKKRG